VQGTQNWPEGYCPQWHSSYLWEIKDCNVEKALDPQVLKEACEKGDQAKLMSGSVRKLHDFPSCMLYLHYTAFSFWQMKYRVCQSSHFFNERFRTTLQSHRIESWEKVQDPPITDFDINEGNNRRPEKCHR